MKERLYREKSLNKIKSPDHLSEYIKVVNPGIWLLMTSVLVLLVGLCCWGILGNIQTVVNTKVQVSDGEAVCTLTGEEGAKIKPGMPVLVEGAEGTVKEVRSQSDGCVCVLELEHPVSDGFYDAQITVESIHPISFLLN
ncbi:hypothetical protein [Fusicatenibacter sp.]